MSIHLNLKKNKSSLGTSLTKCSSSEITRMDYIKKLCIKNYPVYDFFILFLIHAFFLAIVTKNICYY